MSRNYPPEYAGNARLALEIAEKEAAHLGYSHRTLYAHAIDLQRVDALSHRHDLSEQIDALVGRLGRLRDHMGEKLLPHFAALVGENTKTMLDALAFAERMERMEDAEAFFGARKLRNLLVHEYLTDPALFLEALQAADQAAQMLLVTVARIARYAGRIGLSNSP